MLKQWVLVVVAVIFLMVFVLSLVPFCCERRGLQVHDRERAIERARP